MLKDLFKKILPKFVIKNAKLTRDWFENSFLIILYQVIRLIKPPKIPLNKDGKTLLHLGCGSQNDKRFINIDTLPFPHVHYVQKVEYLKNFPKKYADLIYASHVLEHISHRLLNKVLKDWRRVLKNGGILRMSVPDFNKIVRIYKLENNDINKIVGSLTGGQEYGYNFHKSIFNEEYLTELLLLAGFKKIKVWNPDEVEYYSFDDWASKYLEKKYPISLNLEAIK